MANWGRTFDTLLLNNLWSEGKKTPTKWLPSFATKHIFRLNKREREKNTLLSRWYTKKPSSIGEQMVINSFGADLQLKFITWKTRQLKSHYQKKKEALKLVWIRWIPMITKLRFSGACAMYKFEVLLDLFVYVEIPFIVKIKRIDLVGIIQYQGPKRYIQHRCLNQSKFLYST